MTVLLKRYEQLALSYGFQSSFIEAPDDCSLAELLYPRMHQVLRKLSMMENGKARARSLPIDCCCGETRRESAVTWAPRIKRFVMKLMH